MPTDKCSSQPPLKKFLFPAERDHYKIPRLFKIQRTTDTGVPKTHGHIYNTVLVPKAQEHHGRGVEKLEKPKYQEVCCEILHPKKYRNASTMKPYQ